jgi:hypothetical protein
MCFRRCSQVMYRYRVPLLHGATPERRLLASVVLLSFFLAVGSCWRSRGSFRMRTVSSVRFFSASGETLHGLDEETVDVLHESGHPDPRAPPIVPSDELRFNLETPSSAVLVRPRCPKSFDFPIVFTGAPITIQRWVGWAGRIGSTICAGDW